MAEVSCKATRIILETLVDADLPVERLEDGLPVTVAELCDPSRRIEWNLFAEVLERVEALARGVMTPQQIGERMVKAPSFELVRRIGRLAMSPRHLYTLATRLVAPALFANVIVSQEWLPSGRLVVSGEILPGYRESAAFFALCHGNVAATPRVLDLPASAIEEQTVSGRRGHLVLVLPPSHTLATRVRRGARALATIGRGWRTIGEQQVELEASLAALRSSRQELQQLLERLPDGVLIHESGVVRWANAALLDVLGVASVEVVRGRRVVDLAAPDDRAAVALALALARTDGASTREHRLLRSDGSVRRVQAGAAQIVEFEGVRARLVVLRDVTDHHRIREQAAIADRLASIGALAAGVAHEINNPLAYARLSLEMASRRPSVVADRELGATLALARAGTDQALAIVRDLKMLSRVSDERKEAVDLPALLDAAFGLAGATLASKARVVRRYGPTPLAFGPRGRLSQVFLNLLSNAADAVPEGVPSRHEIGATTRTDDRGRAVVEIHDTGCGIAPEVAPRIFDAFFTTKPVGVGTGLGLAMCHRIVTELGGELTFESAPGATTFRVVLPPAPEG